MERTTSGLQLHLEHTNAPRVKMATLAGPMSFSAMQATSESAVQPAEWMTEEVSTGVS